MRRLTKPGGRPLIAFRQLRGQAASRGGMLIEVMVSIVISAVALLALAGVNASALRYTKMSQYRATATLLANDIGERMRVNKGKPAVDVVVAEGFFAGYYDYSEDFAAQDTNPTLPAELCNTTASSCTTQQIAQLDLLQWRLQVRTQLPEGSVFVSRQVGANAADVWLAWRDPAVASDGGPALAQECPDGLNLGDDKSVRCSYFRINL